MEPHQKYHYLFLMTKLAEKITRSLSKDVQALLTNFIDQVKTLGQILEKGARSEDKKTAERAFQEQYEISEKAFKLFFDSINDEASFEAFRDVLISEIHRLIEEGNSADVYALVLFGEKILHAEAFVDGESSNFGTFVTHAFIKNNIEVAQFLLEKGACLPFGFGSNNPLLKAINNKQLDFAKLFITYGIKISPEQASDFSPLYKAIEAGDLELVQMILAHGARLKVYKSPQGLLTVNSQSPLSYALKCNQTEIAKYLFDEFKKDPNLFESSLNNFLSTAPLELLKYYIEDTTIDTEVKLATLVILRSGQAANRTSGEILLTSLLKHSDHPQERLALMKKTIQELMTVESLESGILSEPCYADKHLLEELARTRAEMPIGDLAQTLLTSMNQSCKQGRVEVGLRVLKEVLFSVDTMPESFSLGVHFIKKTVAMLKKYIKEHTDIPNVEMVNQLVDKAELQLELDERPLLPISNEAIRFRAMAGGSTFSHLNPNLPQRGTTVEAVEWYREILTILVCNMREIGILQSHWSETKAHLLLSEIKEITKPELVSSQFNAITQGLSEVSGFQLDIPDHFISSILYRDQDKWTYTVMCRVFINPSEDPNKRHAVEFEIPEMGLDDLRKALVNQLKRNLSEITVKDEAQLDRAIHFELLSHFLEVEKCTRSQCVYSKQPLQKGYKEMTCFASNIKSILSLMLLVMAKPNTTSEQWEQFNHRIKTAIKEEMTRAQISLEPFEQSLERIPQKTLPPQQVAYKLITTLMRWLEINHFNPTSPAEIAGKEATIQHVLRRSQEKFRLKFFNSNALETPINTDTNLPFKTNP